MARQYYNDCTFQNSTYGDTTNISWIHLMVIYYIPDTFKHGEIHTMIRPLCLPKNAESGDGTTWWD